MLSSIRDRVPADVRADVDEVRDELAATRQELRDLCQGVHPAILVEAGLEAAIRALARRSPLPVRVLMRADGTLSRSCEVTAFYVTAEAFTNAAKHASASAVDILIEEADGTLTVQIRDDGVGRADASRGSGLTGLRDRVEAVGGSMTLNSTAGPARRPCSSPSPQTIIDPNGPWRTPAARTGRPGRGTRQYHERHTGTTPLACTRRLPPADRRRYTLATMISIAG